MLTGIPVISRWIRSRAIHDALPAMKNGQCDVVPLDVDRLALLNLLRPVRYVGFFDGNRALTPITPLATSAVFLEKRVSMAGLPTCALPEGLRGFRMCRPCS